MSNSGKLVRDRIPEIIAANRDACNVRVLDDEELAQRLDEKLAEEVAEYLQSRQVEELVDIAEVMRAILAHRRVSQDEFAQLSRSKRTLCGGFNKRLYLEP